MIKKQEKCLYCGEKMESKTAKKRFCSDVHRVYYNREQQAKNPPKPKASPLVSGILHNSILPKLEPKKEDNIAPLPNQPLDANNTLSVQPPPHLTGIDLSIWKAEQKEKQNKK